MAIMATPVNHEDNMTPDVITHTLNQVIDQMMPQHALQRVQRYLQREYRKPAKMRVCNYYQRLVFINAQELPKLPPFGAEAQQWFNDADLIDILLFATPKKWQREMDRMGLNPLTKSSSDLLAFMENCESIEDYDTTGTTMARKPNNSKNGNKKGAKPSDPKKQKWCENHGWSNHTTVDCNQNKPGFKKGNNKPKGKACGNKTNARSAWQHKTDKTTKEVNKKGTERFCEKDDPASRPTGSQIVQEERR